MNLITCPSCQRSFIAEEFPSHSCRTVFIKKTENIHYTKIIITEIDGRDVGYILSEEGTLYHFTPTRVKRLDSPTEDDNTHVRCFATLG